MAEILKVPVLWSNFSGAPGYTNLFFRDFTGGGVTANTIEGAVNRVDAWLDAIKEVIPSGIQMVIPAGLEVLEETTGTLVRYVTGDPAPAHTATATGNYSAASGACINWYTGGIRNGRRLRGRTFLVPLGANAYGPDGTLATDALANLKTATDALVVTTDEGDLGVWGRPRPGAADGVWHVVESYTIPDKAAVLRSRRD